MLALGAAVEAGRIYLMAGGPQPVRHRLPNPAALVRAVDQDESRHHAVSLYFVMAGLDAWGRPLSALQGEGGGPGAAAPGGEAGGATILLVGPPHPALSPRPARERVSEGSSGQISMAVNSRQLRRW